MYYNTDSKTLAEMAIDKGEAVRLSTGAICVDTGEYKGRAPTAKSYSIDSITEDKIDWSSNNGITEEEFMEEWKSFLEYKSTLHPVYCQEVQAVRNESQRVDIVAFTEMPHHALFVRNMFVTELRDFGDSQPWRIFHFPRKEKEAKVLISFAKKAVLITGTFYSGEIKKSIFSVLNFEFPQQGHLPMHCSVNVDKQRKNPAIFFGLSGTGKTTLSSDENRILIGDDEHAWTDTGITNFEGGCYAKTIRLSKEAEPQIWEACNKSGAILENVVYSKDLVPDYDDGSISENARASYPCSNIPDADPTGYVNEHPKNIVMLTCDAFGVLPPVMKLSPDDAVRQFLLGYTAKVAGTEAGVVEPQATFSACFGAPFMPLPPQQYADILRKKMVEHQTDCWLVNTGWSGGSYGVGDRMPIAVTRKIIDKIHDGTLADCETMLHEPTGFTIPVCPDLPQDVMIPENSWSSRDDYKTKAQQLTELFSERAALVIS